MFKDPRNIKKKSLSTDTWWSPSDSFFIASVNFSHHHLEGNYRSLPRHRPLAVEPRATSSTETFIPDGTALVFINLRSFRNWRNYQLEIFREDWENYSCQSCTLCRCVINNPVGISLIAIGRHLFLNDSPDIAFYTLSLSLSLCYTRWWHIVTSLTFEFSQSSLLHPPYEILYKIIFEKELTATVKLKRFTSNVSDRCTELHRFK